MKTTILKFIGLTIAFFVSGSAHYASGEKKKGICWFVGLTTLSGMAVACLCIPGTIPFTIAALLVLAYLILWIFMLKQSFRTLPRLRVWQWVSLILVWLGLNFTTRLSREYICQAFSVPGRSMQPTLEPHDLIIVNKLAYHFASTGKGDIVAFKQDGTIYVKRIANLPLEAGTLISGRSVQLAQNEYFVLGDNSANSKDSRYFGPVQESNIVGKVVRIYWPPDRINKL